MCGAVWLIPTASQPLQTAMSDDAASPSMRNKRNEEYHFQHIHYDEFEEYLLTNQSLAKRTYPVLALQLIMPYNIDESDL